MSDLGRMLAVLALIAGNAFFVIAEYAVVAARRGQLAEAAAAGGRGARAALRLMDDPVRVISTVQVGITAIGILTGAIGEPLVRDLLGGSLPPTVSFLLAFALVTYLTVVLGELVPKALTLDRAERLAAATAPAIELCAMLLRPVVWGLQHTARLLLRPFGVREVVVGDAVRSPEELRAIVDEAEAAGVIPRAQEELLHNVFRFADREAADVMVPAPDVVWLDGELTCEPALEQALASAHIRYPVGLGSIDRMIGVVELRDLVTAAREQPAEPLATLARPAIAVPETKDLGPLLRELRERGEQLALVLDEYGGTIGIVTSNDIVEELVGDIEHELPEGRFVRLEDGAIEVDGSMPIDDINESLGAELPQDGPRTVAGLVFGRLGRRPVPGDCATVGAWHLTVRETQEARITRVHMVERVEIEPEERDPRS